MLRRRFWGDEIGIFSLERPQLEHQFVVFGVRNFRVVVHVIAFVVVSYLRAQLRYARFGIASHDSASALTVSRKLAIRVGVNGPPRSSCRAPCSRSLRLRAVASNSSNVCVGVLGPGRTANRLK